MLLNDPVPWEEEWNEVSPDAFKICQMMLQKDRSKRCTMETVMGSAWLNNGKEIAVSGKLQDD